MLLCLLAATACSSKPESPSLTTPDVTAAITAPPVPTQTTGPTSTVEPKTVVLLASEGSDPADALTIQTLLGELSATAGMSLETWSVFPQLELNPEVRLMVVLPPDPGVSNLVAANPQVQFLAIGIENLQAGSNLSLIESGGSRSDQQGFLAGYLAAVITPDWRVGVISRADQPQGKAARLGFYNGAVFFCGLCRPIYPPFVQYPLYVELPVDASQVEQQAAADQLLASAVKTVYIAPATGDDFLLEYLVQAGTNLIGSVAPADPLISHWAASIMADPSDSIRQLWPKLLNGEGGNSLGAALTLTHVNQSILSQGRQRLVEQMLTDLLAGHIDTGVDPQTGELR